MKTVDIIVVRIYIREAFHLLDKIVEYLKSEEIKISGMSVFRAINGFGQSGSSTAALVDLSLSLPLIIEFFDADKSKIEKVLSYLGKLVKPGHIVFWEGKALL
jgi:uncharacterized protein